jgi:hypothetical protein
MSLCTKAKSVITFGDQLVLYDHVDHVVRYIMTNDQRLVQKIMIILTIPDMWRFETMSLWIDIKILTVPYLSSKRKISIRGWDLKD